MVLDKEVDAAFVYFKEISPAEVKKTISLSESLNVDMDINRNILEIEILNVNKNIPKDLVQNLNIACA